MHKKKLTIDKLDGKNRNTQANNLRAGSGLVTFHRDHELAAVRADCICARALRVSQLSFLWKEIDP